MRAAKVASYLPAPREVLKYVRAMVYKQADCATANMTPYLNKVRSRYQILVARTEH